MATDIQIHTRVEPEIEVRAASVLEQMGLTVSDAVRILLTRTANDGAPPFSLAEDPTEYDQWFRESVQGALDDPGTLIPSTEVNAAFTLRKSGSRAAAE